MKATSTTLPKITSHNAPKTSCTHSRLVDDVLSTKGAKTGHLICLECKAVFPDPHSQKPSH